MSSLYLPQVSLLSLLACRRKQRSYSRHASAGYLANAAQIKVWYLSSSKDCLGCAASTTAMYLFQASSQLARSVIALPGCLCLSFVESRGWWKSLGMSSLLKDTYSPFDILEQYLSGSGGPHETASFLILRLKRGVRLLFLRLWVWRPLRLWLLLQLRSVSVSESESELEVEE